MYATTEILTLTLLERVLWHDIDGTTIPLNITPDGETACLVSWQELIVFAIEQEVLFLVYEAIKSLPQSQRPPHELLLKWTAQNFKHEKQMQLYVGQLQNFLDMCESYQLKVFPLKGVTLASYYPNPILRDVGDIDLYIEPTQRKEVRQLLLKEGAFEEKQLSVCHDTFKWRGIIWETHFKTVNFFAPQSEHYYQDLESIYTDHSHLCHCNFHSKILGQQYAQRFVCLPPAFNIIYLTAHIQHHLLLDRVTLRQVCDWAMVIHHERTTLAIHETALTQHLAELSLLKLYRALGYFSLKYLGRDGETYAVLQLSDKDKKRGEFLARCILSGQIPHCVAHTEALQHESTLTKIKRFANLLKRCYQLRSLCPRESFYTPWGILKYAYLRRKHQVL